MKHLCGIAIVFCLFIQNAIFMQIRTERLKDGVVVNRGPREGKSEPCRT
jgi:hypothetical protein